VKQAAIRLTMSTKRLRALLNRGLIDGAFRIGGTGDWRIPRESIGPEVSGKARQSVSDSSGSDTSVDQIVKDLQMESASCKGVRVTVAQIFWRLSSYFLSGIQEDSVFPSIYDALSEIPDDKRGDAANTALKKLMFRIQALELVRRETRVAYLKPYTVVVCTPLGAKVILALEKNGWPVHP
jgi:hypothetical protein